MNSRTEFPMKT